MLYFGAEGLVRVLQSPGLQLGLSSLIVGLTIVAFGISAPELALGMNSAQMGQTKVFTKSMVTNALTCDIQITKVYK